MLARYRMARGKRPPDDPLPDGRRVDVRKHTTHVLAPEAAMVERFLVDTTDPERIARFETDYVALLETRFAEDRGPFDALAAEARGGDVYLGCSCPTQSQPDVRRCHTVLALRFMKRRYRALSVVMP